MRLVFGGLALLLAGCTTVVPVEIKQSSSVTRSREAGTRFVVAPGGSILREESTSTVRGVVADVELRTMLFSAKDPVIPAGSRMLRLVQGEDVYYCSTDPVEGVSAIWTLCAQDTDRNGTFDRMHLAESRVWERSHIGLEILGTIENIPFQEKDVQAAGGTVVSELTFDGVQDGYVRVLHSFGLAGREPYYRRLYFAPVPGSPASGPGGITNMFIGLRPFTGFASRGAAGDSLVFLRLRSLSAAGMEVDLSSTWGTWTIGDDLTKRSVMPVFYTVPEGQGQAMAAPRTPPAS